MDGVTLQLLYDHEVQQAAEANDKSNFRFVFDPKLDQALRDSHSKHAEFINRVFGDDDVGRLFRSVMLEAIYRQ